MTDRAFVAAVLAHIAAHLAGRRRLHTWELARLARTLAFLGRISGA